MKFSVKNGEALGQASDCIVLAVFEAGELSPLAQQIDQQTGGAIRQLLANGDMTGKVGQHLLVPAVANRSGRVLLVGCGQAGELSERQFKQVVQQIAQCLQQTTAQTATLALDVAIKGRTADWPLRFAVETLSEYRYRFDDFKSIKGEPLSPLAEVVFVVNGDVAAAETAVKQAQAVATGVVFAKNVANSPPNVCTPKYLAECARELAKAYANVQTTVLDEKEMAALGMNAYLAVSQGSTKHPAYMSIIEYKNHPNPTAKPIVLVGKGMTFDTGGISIKPSEAMDEMKYDMGGAAAVYGTMKAVAEMQLPLNVIGVLAGCENMPDGNAYRPGDILTTMSGLTVEVLNTDAEGRLVLCDALTYVERFDPEWVIDVATLTGACMVALGQHTSGLIASHDGLAEQLLQAASQADDKAWRLPMGEAYQEQLKSNFADLANIGGRFGGAITAGVFLSNFAKKYPWAHLDIAGTAWKSGAAKGATGRPVPLLSQFLINLAKG